MNKRQTVWVDKFQTKMLIRMAAYCILYQVSLSIFVVAWTVFCQYFTNGIRPLQWADFVPCMVGLLLILPMVCWDVIKFTHRLVGPVVRFRRAMRAIAAGDPVGPIQLRNGDYMVELRDDFNLMLTALHERGAVAQPESKDAQQKCVPA